MNTQSSTIILRIWNHGNILRRLSLAMRGQVHPGGVPVTGGAVAADGSQVRV